MADIVFFKDGKVRGKWFKFDEDTEVWINFISRQKLQEINARASKAVGSLADTETDCFNILLGRAAVTQGWRHITIPEHPGLKFAGEPFPFVKDNLDALMQFSLDFSKFINDRCTNAAQFEGVEPKND